MEIARHLRAQHPPSDPHPLRMMMTQGNATLTDDYIASIYFTAVTFATVGYGDIRATNR